MTPIPPQEEGVPQGSSLSLTLFTVKINSIDDVLLEGIEKSLYVDDLAVYCFFAWAFLRQEAQFYSTHEIYER